MNRQVRYYEKTPIIQETKKSYKAKYFIQEAPKLQ